MTTRRTPAVGTLVFAAALLLTLIGLLIALAGGWRAGIYLGGGAFVVAGLARAVMPDRRAGLLRVRRRFSDVLLLVGLGMAILVLVLLHP